MVRLKQHTGRDSREEFKAPYYNSDEFVQLICLVLNIDYGVFLNKDLPLIFSGNELLPLVESDEDEDDNPYIYESYNTSVDGMINLSEHLKSKDFYTLFDDLVVDSDSSETPNPKEKNV